MNVSVGQRYGELAASGRLEADSAQIALVERLDALLARIAGYSPSKPPNALERLIGVNSDEPQQLRHLAIETLAYLRHLGNAEAAECEHRSQHREQTGLPHPVPD